MSTAKRQPRVFISRTTAGLAALAERVAEVLRQRAIEPIIQTGFYPSTHDIKGMLAEHLQQCDAVICLIGTAYGSGPHDPITKAEQPVHGLKDPRTKDRLFSYTQLELLIARDLGRPIYTFFIEGTALPTAFAPEPPELAQRQQTFITEFARDGRNTYGTFSQWDQPADPARGLKQAIEAIKFEITVLAGKPTNLPYTSLGTLFKGRDEFLAELRQHLTAEGPVVIKGKRTIHGMGGVGKTRAAIEYAWKHANDYRALLFISADTPEALHRNLAALCGPLVLNLPEQNEKEQALQVEAALRWLKLHPGWFLIIDNVDTDEGTEGNQALRVIRISKHYACSKKTKPIGFQPGGVIRHAFWPHQRPPSSLMQTIVPSCVLLFPYESDSAAIQQRVVRIAAKNNIARDMVHCINSGTYFEDAAKLAFQLQRASFVVIDFSEIMPLAVWAKGYCDALSINTILISQGAASEYPFDTKKCAIVQYRNTDEGFDALEVEIERALVATEPCHQPPTPNLERPRSGQMPD